MSYAHRLYKWHCDNKFAGDKGTLVEIGDESDAEIAAKDAEIERLQKREAHLFEMLERCERDVRRALTERAEAHAIRVFTRNVRALLSQPPLRR